MLKEGIAIVSVEGIGNIAKWHRLYTALGIRCFCIFDTDSNKTGKDAADLLEKRQDIMAALGHEPDRADSANLSSDAIAVADGYATLNPNFEGAAGALFGARWSELYTKATAVVGESKALRARYAAHRLVDIDFNTDASDVLDRLVQAIRGDTQEDLSADEKRFSANIDDSPERDEPPF